jgi:PAS domain S-box-containing protein
MDMAKPPEKVPQGEGRSSLQGRLNELEHIYRAAPVGLCLLDLDLKYLRINDRLAKMNKLPTIDHLGQSIHEVIPHIAQKIEPLCRRVIEFGEPVLDVELFGRDAAGHRQNRCWMTNYYPLKSSSGEVFAVSVIVQDISSRKIAESQLLEEKLFTDAVIEAMPGLFFLLDEKARLVRWSKNFESALGFSVEELKNRPALELVDPSDRPRIAEAIARVFREGAARTEHNMTTKSGEIVPVFGHGVCIRLEGASYICGSLIDISARKKIEDELETRLLFETFLSDLSASFVNRPVDEVDREIEISLEKILDILDVDRCSLLEFTADKSNLRRIHYSSRTEVDIKLPSLSEWDFPWTTEKLLRGEEVVVERFSDLPMAATREKKYALKGGLKSALTIPLMIGGEALGALGIGAYRTEKRWPPELMQRLRLVGEVYANAVVRKRKEEELSQALAEIQGLKEQLQADYTYLREEIKLEHNFDEIIGQSDALRHVLYKVEQVAPTSTTVLIQGETGTGKELVARAIHNASPRKERPLVKVNCATLPPTLIESELFGHERGAYTSAEARQQGRFELAHGSSIFLDEIGEVPLDLQVKLLRVLQDGEFERLGSPRTIKVDVRVIAATNRDLEEEIKNRRFREDLWYRLNVFPLSVPPLRQRKDDIPLLVQWFVKRFNKKLGKNIETIPKAVVKKLQAYSWPGNIRELENVLERGVISSRGSTLQLADPLEATEQPAAKTDFKGLVEVERNYILKVLGTTNWRIEGRYGAATILGLNPSTLRGRIRKLGIRRD